MKRFEFFGIYWILLFLSGYQGVESLACELSSNFDNVFCETAKTIPEWCHCNDSVVDLSGPGVTRNIRELSPLPYYKNYEDKAEPTRCPPGRKEGICFCPESLNSREKSECTLCNTDGVSEILCLSVDEYNHVIANDQNKNEPGCNFTELCREECNEACGPIRMVTAPPPVRPNMPLTTVRLTTERTDMNENEEVESVFLFVGIGAAVLIIILFGALIYCCRKGKDVQKKESPHEAVYSTIDDGPLQNGNALRLHILYPNQVYDTRVEGPPVPPIRHETPPHHKSLPALNAGVYIPSGFSESAYQPTYPQKQIVWTNHPALYRYPSTDDVTGYKRYNQDEPQTGQYMYLKKPSTHPTQTLPSGMMIMAPEDMQEFLNVSAGGRPGYKEQAVLSVTMDDDAYTRLNRDPRSLPTEGNRKEHENPRQHATYGFERRGHSSLEKGFKPVPAKRGAYRSKGNVSQTSSVVHTEEPDNCSSSDSDYEENRSGSSPYYFKMKVLSEEDRSETEPMMNNSDYQKLADTEKSKPAKKKSSKRNPKPRSCRVRRRPTTEVKGESPSYDEDGISSQGEYTDDDIEEGLNTMNENLKADLRTDKANIDFEDSDYHSPELLSS